MSWVVGVDDTGIYLRDGFSDLTARHTDKEPSRMRWFFIAGCARSGTTLLLELMSSFKDTHAVTGEETHFSDFSKVEATAANLVLKRQRDTHLTLPDLSPEINLIYAVRHPFDTLTSHHPDFPHRKYYVSERRWKDEYAALKRLRAKQPTRVIHYVRYCDLVTSPDAVQRNLANSLHLEINCPFSESGVLFSTSSIGKYQQDRRLERYLWLLPNDLRQEMKQFCDEFGYELPLGYVQPASLPTDTARRLGVLLLSRNWLIESRGFFLLYAPTWLINVMRPLLRRARK
jgi:hypothetical protein